jgi:glucosamine--fructose-6-phosphate aminotransferase (isomerizing)
MCGIFAFVPNQKAPLSPQQTHHVIDSLFLLSESRGKEASGLVVVSHDIARILKHPLKASHLIRTKHYAKLFQRSVSVVVGQTRLATNGHQSYNSNNQPIARNGIIAVHNGIIVNDQQIWKHLAPATPTSGLDTEVICATLSDALKSGRSYEQALQHLMQRIRGSASLIILSEHTPHVFATTNTGSLYLLKAKQGCILASEAWILTTLLTYCPFLHTSGPILHIKPRATIRINIDSGKSTLWSRAKRIVQPATHKAKAPIWRIDDISPKQSVSAFHTAPMKINSAASLEKHVPPYAEIAAISRCTKCILPDTMPFIRFDAYGVCNFCRTHNPIGYYGQAVLEKHIASTIRKTRGTNANCIVALSGGRDSSYGLHYVKTVLGMRPIAYTYDWGMVTDLARRNQARLVGDLGVEHIIVSADIDQKRSYVRRNILAWLKRPNLGMVPLFMAGDKQAEYYAEKLRQQTKIPLIFYCRGNELENEEFKFGHCGVRNGTPQGVTHNLSLNGKIRMAMYYAQSYLQNPAYINGSLFDILSAYYAMYLMPHNFVYLWHYIPWKEDTIIKTLKGKYGWETAPDTSTTWRIDDGTVPFYNYIYYVAQGFTENDTFRSNQIREGILTRTEALRLASEENRPRYEALAWYFNTLSLNGNDVLSVVDIMPKLYRKNRPFMY